MVEINKMWKIKKDVRECKIKIEKKMGKVESHISLDENLCVGKEDKEE